MGVRQLGEKTASVKIYHDASGTSLEYNLKQLQKLLHDFILIFHFFKGFSLQKHAKNSFQSFKNFWNTGLSFKAQLKIEFQSSIKTEFLLPGTGNRQQKSTLNYACILLVESFEFVTVHRHCNHLNFKLIMSLLEHL